MPFKSIQTVVRVQESDHYTAERTARTLTRYYEHRDTCEMCQNVDFRKKTFRCYQGDLLWKAAQKAATPEVRSIPVNDYEPRPRKRRG